MSHRPPFSEEERICRNCRGELPPTDLLRIIVEGEAWHPKVLKVMKMVASFLSKGWPSNHDLGRDLPDWLVSRFLPESDDSVPINEARSLSQWASGMRLRGWLWWSYERVQGEPRWVINLQQVSDPPILGALRFLIEAANGQIVEFPV